MTTAKTISGVGRSKASPKVESTQRTESASEVLSTVIEDSPKIEKQMQQMQVITQQSSNEGDPRSMAGNQAARVLEKMKKDLVRDRKFKRSVFGLDFRKQVDVRSSNDLINNMLATLMSSTAKNLAEIDPSMRASQLESIKRLYSRVLRIKKQNEVVLGHIQNFGLETHLKINNNRIEEGKPIIGYPDGLTEYKTETRLELRNQQSNFLADESSCDSATSPAKNIGLIKKMKLLEFAENGAITNLPLQNGKV